MWWIKASSLRAAPRWRALAVVALAGASVTACASPKAAGFDNHALTPTEQYPLKVEQTPDGVALRLHAEGLSPNERGALAALAGRWREAGGGEIVVRSPSGGGEIAARMASATAAELQSYGIDTVRIEGMDGDGSAPLLVSFNSLRMAVPDCRGGWDNLSSTGQNAPYTHYGCAVSANIAVMIADPRHVLSPADMAPGDASRRQAVLDAYRKGENTSSKREDQANGVVSNVGKQ